MATTNMRQWNPDQNNQETDAQYAADSQRAGGATNPSFFTSILANKLFYQMSTYLTAMFAAFANKGFTTSDSSLSALTAQCSHFLTTADISAGMVTVGYAPTMSFNCVVANGFQVTMTGNITSLSVIGASFGQVVTLAFTQDGVGGRTVVLPANVVTPGTVDGAAGKTSMQRFQQLGDGKLHPIGPMTIS